jgi:hypothetical protein
MEIGFLLGEAGISLFSLFLTARVLNRSHFGLRLSNVIQVTLNHYKK